MSNSELPDDTVKKFRHDLAHRDDTDPGAAGSQPRELSDEELEGIVAGTDPRVTHDIARRAMGIDYPGTELAPDFEPPEHPEGR